MTVYELYKAAGKCPHCGTRPLAPGRSRCLDCLEANARSAREKRKRDRENGIKPPSRAEYKRKRRQKMVAEGRCIDCGKPICSKSTVHCIDHYLKNRAKSKRWREEHEIMSQEERKARVAEGFCYFCGKPVKDGLNAKNEVFSVCEECYSNAIKNLDKCEDVELRKAYVRNEFWRFW